MPDPHSRHLDVQQERFEGTSTLLERLIKHPSFPRTMRKKMDFVRRQLEGRGRVLEVGTGHGLELDLLLERIGPGVDYIGIDLATAPLRSAHEVVTSVPGGRAAFLAAVVEKLPFPDGTFDAVYCVDVLHHAESQAVMLTEIGRVLRPGGVVICVEPNPVFPVNMLFLRNPVENGLFKFTHRNARAWVREAGLMESQILQLPIFLPSFPVQLAGVYDRLERGIGAIPVVRDISTSRVLLARKPADATTARPHLYTPSEIG